MSVDASCERRGQTSRFIGQFVPVGRGDAIETNGASNEIGFQPVRTQDFGQSSQPLSAKVVELEQPVLGHRHPEAQKQVLVIAREDVGDSAVIANDPRRRTHPGLHCLLDIG